MNLKQFATLLFAVLAAPCVVQAQQDDSILVDEYIITQDYVEAEVLHVKPSVRKITVRGDKHGMTREFAVPENARITINGKDGKLRDLRRGDKVLLVMQPRADEVVISRVRVPDSATTLEQRRAEPSVAEAKPAMLPKTAGNLPTILVIGGLACLAAAGMRLARRRV